ncbi:putative ATP-grasp-modified RiPP [Nonomuraea jabiensis]|uniref:putative ATP-grasp-modified RiPP n=1 Tax=Nonomuraea jabiensis TaxID=882448 RepID=UPI003431FF14
MTTQAPLKPWGLTRATPHLPQAPQPWADTRLDPGTQLTVFLDEHGEPIDAKGDGTNRTFATVSESRPHDGETNAPLRPDDSPTDRETD